MVLTKGTLSTQDNANIDSAMDHILVVREWFNMYNALYLKLDLRYVEVYT